MIDGPVLLTVAQVLAVHNRVIAEFGGALDVRDQGLLESAVALPGAMFGGQFLHDGLAAMAAAYLFHLCKNHPFVDGNKRTALAVAAIFLQVNNLRLTATDEELEHLTLGVAQGTVSKDEATAFFRTHTRA